MLCVDERLPSKLVTAKPEIETLIIQVGRSPTLKICLSYKPPNASVEVSDCLYTTLRKISNSREVIILGDFNCPDVDWSSLSADSIFSSKLCELAFDKNLTQLISSPTHMRGNILDLVLTNLEEKLIYDVKVEEVNKYSDHFLVYFTISNSLPHPTKSPKFSLVPDYSKADYEGMCLYLLDHDFSDYLQSENIDELCLYLKSLLKETVDMFVPKVRVSYKNSPKWFTPEIRHGINKLRHLKRRYKQHPSSNLQRVIIDKENLIQEEINTARADWEEKLVAESAGFSSHKIYKHIRNLS